MSRQSHARAVMQRGAPDPELPRLACRKGIYMCFFLVLRCVLICILFIECWEAIFLPDTPDVCRGVRATVTKEFTCGGAPLASDVCLLSLLAFVNAAPLFSSLLPRSRPAAEPKESLSNYVSRTDGRAEQGRATTIGGNLHVSGKALAGSPEAGTYGRVIGSPHFDRTAGDYADKGEHGIGALQRGETKAGKQRRQANVSNSEFTWGSGHNVGLTAGTPDATVGKETLTEWAHPDSIKAARTHRIVAAKEQKSRVRVAHAHEEANTRQAKGTAERKILAGEKGANRTDKGKQQASSRVVEDVLQSVWATTERKAANELSEEEIEKIQRGIRFTRKFDFDQACDEAQRESTFRLVWNIIYTDEYLMAQKLYEKMEAYVLRQYIALLQQKRELQRIPIVGNPQLMQLVRSLLKREHIKTTKTDAEIGRLFRKVPRLFDWIPSVSDEGDETGSTTVDHVDEL